MYTTPQTAVFTLNRMLMHTVWNMEMSNAMVSTIRRMEAEVDNFHTAHTCSAQCLGFLRYLKTILSQIFLRMGLLEYTRVMVTVSVMHTFPDSSDIKGFAVVMLATKSWAGVVCLLVIWSNGGELS